MMMYLFFIKVDQNYYNVRVSPKYPTRCTLVYKLPTNYTKKILEKINRDKPGLLKFSSSSDLVKYVSNFFVDFEEKEEVKEYKNKLYDELLPKRKDKKKEKNISKKELDKELDDYFAKAEVKNGIYETANYTKFYKDGKLHRDERDENGETLPAVIWANGAREWYTYGRRDRIDGPAFIKADGSMEWWVDGNLYKKT